jgi:hypothetical protein
MDIKEIKKQIKDLDSQIAKARGQQRELRQELQKRCRHTKAFTKKIPYGKADGWRGEVRQYAWIECPVCGYEWQGTWRDSPRELVWEKGTPKHALPALWGGDTQHISET